MAPPPKKFTLAKDEIPDAPEWFSGPVLDVLNPFALATQAALQRGLTYRDNVLSELKRVTFTAPHPVWRPSYRPS